MGAPLGPLWSSRLSKLLQDGGPTGAAGCCPAIRAETWLLLRAALIRSLERQARRSARVRREDLEDLASDKSLELVLAAESGKWRVEDRTPGEIAGYLTSVARNALVDHVRRCGRLTRDAEPEPPAGPERPDVVTERREFSVALQECVEKLATRSRLVWLFRAFCGMSAREIAAHPEVNLKPGHVDVMLHRTRHLVGDCMRRKGFKSTDIPPGTFVELWKFFRMRTPAIDGGAGDGLESERKTILPSQ